ncbi:MAG: nicotinate-nucleotide adenylyltransferase [Candidatus Omnitrophota bacterium]
MKIGILGGTFNPVHKGHLQIAKEAAKRLKLDRVIFVPTYIPPHKKMHGNATAGDRVRMLRMALSKHRNFSISLYEIKRKGTSYTVNTVKYLKRRYGSKAQFYFLMGSDSLKGLNRWRRIEPLFKMVKFIVAPRQGSSAARVDRRILRMDIPMIDISSTAIRRLIRRGENPRDLIAEGVCAYMEEKGLYI